MDSISSGIQVKQTNKAKQKQATVGILWGKHSSFPFEDAHDSFLLDNEQQGTINKGYDRTEWGKEKST